jgi:hypothetical protein
VPAARAIPRDAERPYAIRHRAGQTEPYPSGLRDLNRCPFPIQLPHAAWLDRDDAESLVSVGFAPRWSTAGTFEEVLHGLSMIADGLLLDDYGPGGKPRVIGPCFGQLPTPLSEAGRLSPPGAPFVFLLNTQIPYVPRMSTMPQQYGLLFKAWLKAISSHVKIVTVKLGQEDIMAKTWPSVVRLWSSHRIGARGVCGGFL